MQHAQLIPETRQTRVVIVVTGQVTYGLRYISLPAGGGIVQTVLSAGLVDLGKLLEARLKSLSERVAASIVETLQHAPSRRDDLARSYINQARTGQHTEQPPQELLVVQAVVLLLRLDTVSLRFLAQREQSA